MGAPATQLTPAERVDAILDAIDGARFEDATHQAAELRAEQLPPFWQAFVDFLVHYCEAQREWLISYKYGSIRKSLRCAIACCRTFDRGGTASSSESEVLRTAQKLAISMARAMEIENAEVCSDAKRMAHYAGRARRLTRSARALAETDNYASVSKRLNEALQSQGIYYTALHAYAQLLAIELTDPEAFLRGVKQVSADLRTASEELLQLQLTESAKHVTVCRRFLEAHATRLTACPSRLFMRDVHIVSMINWAADPRAVATFGDHLAEHCDLKETQVLLGSWATGTANRPKSMDLYSTLLGKGGGRDRVRATVIPCGVARMQVFGTPVDVRVELKLHAFGVCGVHFGFAFDALPANHARQVQGLVAPHAGEHVIQWNGEKKASLPEIAEQIQTSFHEALAKFADSHPKLVLDGSAAELTQQYMAHLNWYSFVWATKWELRSPTESTELESVQPLIDADHPDLRALAIPPREARATIDDWVSASTPDIRQANLAPIRSHTGDLMLVSESHAVLFYPDDPFYLVNQFAETVELVAKLRCLAVSMNREAELELERVQDSAVQLRKNLDQLGYRRGVSEEDFDRTITKLVDHLVRITELRDNWTLTVELIGMSMTSQYRDHAEQTRRAIDAAGIPTVTRSLEAKLEMMKADAETVSAAASLKLNRWRANHERSQAKKVNAFLILIGAMAAVPLFDDLANAYAHGSNPEKWLGVELWAIFAFVCVLLLSWVLRAGVLARWKRQDPRQPNV